MIAEKSARCQGHAKRAVSLMLMFGIEKLQLTRFKACIKRSNSSSIAMFCDRLGFTVDSVSEVFDQVTVVASVTDDLVRLLKRLVE